jgi:hypothetical protein
MYMGDMYDTKQSNIFIEQIPQVTQHQFSIETLPYGHLASHNHEKWAQTWRVFTFFLKKNSMPQFFYLSLILEISGWTWGWQGIAFW